MKKIVAAAAVCVTLFCASLYGGINTRNMIKTGSLFRDFIVGMKGTAVYSLNSFLGKGPVILAFMDSGEASGNFKKTVMRYIKNLPPRNTVWFNITFESGHAVIEAVSGGLGLRYRTLSGNIPETYRFPCLPSVIILDRNGIVQFVYAGYSPTVMSDISDWLIRVK
ncbi:MAG: hypothetical protein ABSA34_01405 [Candidatus Goldiibacteriota bacterium]|jgi:hypothetical protein